VSFLYVESEAQAVAGYRPFRTVSPFPSYGFVLDTFQEVGYLSGVLRIFLLHLPVYLRAVVYPIVYFLGGEHTDIARLFVLVARLSMS
jgi:hypothetical protein